MPIDRSLGKAREGPKRDADGEKPSQRLSAWETGRARADAVRLPGRTTHWEKKEKERVGGREKSEAFRSSSRLVSQREARERRLFFRGEKKRPLLLHICAQWRAASSSSFRYLILS